MFIATGILSAWYASAVYRSIKVEKDTTNYREILGIQAPSKEKRAKRFKNPLHYIPLVNEIHFWITRSAEDYEYKKLKKRSNKFLEIAGKSNIENEIAYSVLSSDNSIEGIAELHRVTERRKARASRIIEFDYKLMKAAKEGEEFARIHVGSKLSNLEKIGFYELMESYLEEQGLQYQVVTNYRGDSPDVFVSLKPVDEEGIFLVETGSTRIQLNPFKQLYTLDIEKLAAVLKEFLREGHSFDFSGLVDALYEGEDREVLASTYGIQYEDTVKFNAHLDDLLLLHIGREVTNRVNSSDVYPFYSDIDIDNISARFFKKFNSYLEEKKYKRQVEESKPTINEMREELDMEPIEEEQQKQDCTTHSWETLISYMNERGMDVSFSNRAKLSKVLLLHPGYVGSSTENKRLLEALKENHKANNRKVEIRLEIHK